MITIKEELIEAKKVFKRVGYALFFCALITLLFEIGISVLFDTLLEKGIDLVNNDWYIWVLTDVPLYCFGFIAFILIIKKTPKEIKEKVKLKFKDLLTYMLMCFPIANVGSLIGTGLSYVLTNNTSVNPLDEYLEGNFVLRIIFMAILAPIFEELVFRKVLIDHTRKYGDQIAILFSGLAFGLFHMNLYQFFYAFALGMFFAYIYTKTSDIKYTIIMHMVFNFVGSVISAYILSLDLSVLETDLESILMSSENINSIIIPMLSIEAYVLAFYIVNVVGVILLVKKRKEFKQGLESSIIPKKLIFKIVYLNSGYILYVVFTTALSLVNLYGIKLSSLFK